MTAARASLSQPPLVLADGRLLIYPDGEYMAFYGPKNSSWTTGTLDGRDLAALQQYLPAVVDNVTDVYGKEVV